MSNKIFVGNLPFSTTPDDLKEVFGGFGDIQGVNIRKDRKTNQPRGFAFVTFVNEEAVSVAVSTMHGHSYEGRVLTVNTADARGSSTNADSSSRDEEVDNSWKTAPPSRRNKASSSSKKGKKSNKTDTRSWDEWAAPTAKISEQEIPKTVPLVSPESSKNEKS